MDTISKAKKLQAMKGYQSDRFFHNLISHLLVALACSLLCFYYPDGFPSLRLSIKHFSFLSFPKMLSSFLCPKWLFVVVNVIVAYLVGESKLVASKSSSPAGEIYDEYVERSRAMKGVSALREKAENSKLDSDIIVEKRVVVEVVDQHRNVNEISEDVIELLSKKEDKKLAEEEDDEEHEKEEGKKEEDDDKEKERDVEEGEIGMPAEELNRRVEEFIARVNKQRWLEGKLLICCKA